MVTAMAIESLLRNGPASQFQAVVVTTIPSYEYTPRGEGYLYGFTGRIVQFKDEPGVWRVVLLPEECPKGVETRVLSTEAVAYTRDVMLSRLPDEPDQPATMGRFFAVLERDDDPATVPLDPSRHRHQVTSSIHAFDMERITVVCDIPADAYDRTYGVVAELGNGFGLRHLSDITLEEGQAPPPITHVSVPELDGEAIEVLAVFAAPVAKLAYTGVPYMSGVIAQLPL